MTVPTTTPPARPVDDAIIETAWGGWAHDWLAYLTEHRPRARVYRTGGATAPTGVHTPVPFTAARYNAGPLWSAGAPTRLTLTEPGLYRLGGNIRFAYNQTGFRQAQIRLNGTVALAIANVMAVGPATNVTDLNVTTEHQCAAGDYVELVAYHTAGADLGVTASGGAPEMWAAWDAPTAA